MSGTPCSWENTQQLIKWFEGGAQIKAYVQLIKTLKIRGKWGIVIGIKPENKSFMVASTLVEIIPQTHQEEQVDIDQKLTIAKNKPLHNNSA